MVIKKTRFKDIAGLSGVSTGSIICGLHEHGKTSEKTRKKVLRIPGELDYTTYVMAQ